MALLLLSALDALPRSPILRWGLVLVLLIPLVTRRGRSGAVGLSTALVALLPLFAQVVGSQHVERTFFGVHRVTQEDSILRLTHGNTFHGSQDVTSSQTRRIPTSYYHPSGPLGDVMQLPQARGSVAAIGLGAGSVAAYGREGDRFTFYEIDPVVEEIARQYFSYLSDSEASISVEIGDGRLTIATAETPYALIVLDAFSSDAIPVHLLTVEAFAAYATVLEEDGLIAINVSNRYLDLRPVVSAAADQLGMEAIYRAYDGGTAGADPADWVVLAPRAETVAPLIADDWEALPPARTLWTDQRSSMWALLVR